MRCPKCQVDVPDGHFYCPSCRVSVYNYAPEGRLAGSRLERAARRLLDLLLLLALIGGGIVLARAIKWKELLNNFNSSAEATPSVNRNHRPLRVRPSVAQRALPLNLRLKRQPNLLPKSHRKRSRKKRHQRASRQHQNRPRRRRPNPIRLIHNDRTAKL